MQAMICITPEKGKQAPREDTHRDTSPKLPFAKEISSVF